MSTKLKALGAFSLLALAASCGTSSGASGDPCKTNADCDNDCCFIQDDGDAWCAYSASPVLCPGGGGGGSSSGNVGPDGVHYPATLTSLGTPGQQTAHVQLYFSVADAVSNPVTGRVTADFEAREDGVAVDPYESAFRVRLPENILKVPTVLVLDLSQSVVAANGLEDVKRAADIVIDSLTAEQELMILSFSGDITVRSPFSRSKAALHQAVERINGADGISTNLYGALIHAYGEFTDGLREIGSGAGLPPLSCYPALSGCSPQGTPPDCTAWCQVTASTDCNHLCWEQLGEQQFSPVTNYCVRTCAPGGTGDSRACDDRCVEAGYLGCDDATGMCERAAGPTTQLVAGLVIVVSDGSDTAGVHTLQEVVSVRGNKRTLFVSVGDELDPNIARQIANVGAITARTFGQLDQAINDATDRIQRANKSIYVAEYCSPKRAGSHQLEFTLKRNQELQGVQCTPSGVGPSCSGEHTLYCGSGSGNGVCCRPDYPFHCPSSGYCYATASAAAADCPGACTACGQPNTPGQAGLSITLPFNATGYNDQQCAALF
jgi:uncharacterized protein YegL